MKIQKRVYLKNFKTGVPTKVYSTLHTDFGVLFQAKTKNSPQHPVDPNVKTWKNIALIPAKEGEVTKIDKNLWKSTQGIQRYITEFLNKTVTDIKNGIKNGEYQLVDLNEDKIVN